MRAAGAPVACQNPCRPITGERHPSPARPTNRARASAFPSTGGGPIRRGLPVSPSPADPGKQQLVRQRSMLKHWGGLSRHIHMYVTHHYERR